jgi:hypothetical protein
MVSAGREPQDKQEWLYIVPLPEPEPEQSRDVNTNSASTEFYSVIEQVTRHLDRNMITI